MYDTFLEVKLPLITMFLASAVLVFIPGCATLSKDTTPCEKCISATVASDIMGLFVDIAAAH